MGKKLTLEQVKEEFYKRGYVPLFDSYNNSHELLEYKCPKHPDEKLTINLNNLKNGKGCKFCSGKNTITFEEAKEEFSKRGYIPLFSEYKNARTNLEYKCPSHPGEILSIKLYNLKNGYGCPFCAGNVRNSVDYVKDFFRKKGYIPLFDDYQNNETPLKFQCPNHPDKELAMTFGNLLKGRECRYCVSEKTQSKGCERIETFLKEKGFSFEREATFDDCKSPKGRKLKFDFLVATSDGFSLIEYDGEQHFYEKDSWGGKEKLKLTQQYDLIKNDFCSNKNIPFLRIKFSQKDRIEKILEGFLI